MPGERETLDPPAKAREGTFWGFYDMLWDVWKLFFGFLFQYCPVQVATASPYLVCGTRWGGVTLATDHIWSTSWMTNPCCAGSPPFVLLWFLGPFVSAFVLGFSGFRV